MEKLKKTIRCLDSITDKILFFIFLFLFLIGLYAMYDSFLVYQAANDTSILKYKPGYEGTAPDKPIKGNMVGWLTIDDTKIDYPIMQGEDNNEYLNKDPFGDYSLSGSIFLDSRNTSDFSDDYSLIYGHHMENDLMFGALDHYLKKGYLEKHNRGTIYVDDVPYKLTLFAVGESEATNEIIFAPTFADAGTVCSFIKQNALYFDESVKMQKNDKIIALSTCKYPDTVERTLVFGYLTMD